MPIVADRHEDRISANGKHAEGEKTRHRHREWKQETNILNIIDVMISGQGGVVSGTT